MKSEDSNQDKADTIGRERWRHGEEEVDVVKQEHYTRKQAIQAPDKTDLSDKSAICPHLLFTLFFF